MEKKEKLFTRKQIITMIVCTLVIILVCGLLYMKNQKLIKEHPEYSVYGVSEERRDNAELLLNKLISSNGVDSKKISDDRIYHFNSKGFRKDVLLGETDDTLKLLVALENTEKVKITDYNSLNDCDCIEDKNKDTYSLKIEDVKKTYFDMFGEELTNLTSVISDYYSYFYNEFNNLFYAVEVNYNSEEETEYYVYYNNYNSPYEHPDKATVDVSVLAVSKENDGLYTVSDIYGDAIVKHLSSSEVETYVKDDKNYKSNDLVTYLFNNNSSYGLTFSSIIKKG